MRFPVKHVNQPLPDVIWGWTIDLNVLILTLLLKESPDTQSCQILRIGGFLSAHRRFVAVRIQ